MNYYACTSDKCFPLSQQYTIKIENQNRGARTFGMNKGQSAHKSNPSKTASRRMINMDTSKDGFVSFDEFYNKIKKRQGKTPTREKAQQRFEKIDTNKDGLISLEELKRSMKSTHIQNP
ncbi:EF-hand [Saccharicrinis fermentans DSM 9555 = JCM 21142]|uniref:EF-hand n=3 Tax=Saccharicrinis fermentans TaxID=982 RepID=W7XZA2_9BACT|nr:EF-hand [Saccharicrinis fermentans DSM 9555 = JCM 21142]